MWNGELDILLSFHPRMCPGMEVRAMTPSARRRQPQAHRSRLSAVASWRTIVVLYTYGSGTRLQGDHATGTGCGGESGLPRGLSLGACLQFQTRSEGGSHGTWHVCVV
jgi:hypothetical protein